MALPVGTTAVVAPKLVEGEGLDCTRSIAEQAAPRVRLPAFEHEHQPYRGTLAMAYSLARENRALADMRNLLLPRLVTGQIDVCEVDLDALTESVA